MLVSSELKNIKAPKIPLVRLVECGFEGGGGKIRWCSHFFHQISSICMYDPSFWRAWWVDLIKDVDLVNEDDIRHSKRGKMSKYPQNRGQNLRPLLSKTHKENFWGLFVFPIRDGQISVSQNISFLHFFPPQMLMLLAYVKQ